MGGSEDEVFVAGIKRETDKREGKGERMPFLHSGSSCRSVSYCKSCSSCNSCSSLQFL